jgi:hypothetical protein
MRLEYAFNEKESSRANPDVMNAIRPFHLPALDVIGYIIACMALVVGLVALDLHGVPGELHMCLYGVCVLRVLLLTSQSSPAKSADRQTLVDPRMPDGVLPQNVRQPT